MLERGALATFGIGPFQRLAWGTITCKTMWMRPFAVNAPKGRWALPPRTQTSLARNKRKQRIETTKEKGFMVDWIKQGTAAEVNLDDANLEIKEIVWDGGAAIHKWLWPQCCRLSMEIYGTKAISHRLWNDVDRIGPKWDFHLEMPWSVSIYQNSLLHYWSDRHFVNDKRDSSRSRSFSAYYKEVHRQH